MKWLLLQGDLSRARAEPVRFRVIDASRPLAEVTTALDAILDAYLARSASPDPGRG